MSEKSWALDPIWRESIKEGPTFKTTGSNIAEQDIISRIYDKMVEFLRRFGETPGFLAIGHYEARELEEYVAENWGTQHHVNADINGRTYAFGLPLLVVDRDSFLGVGC